MEIKIFVLSLGPFWFSNFYENVAKHNKRNLRFGRDIRGQKLVKLLEKSA